MSDNHPTTCEQDARRESFAAELTSAAYPLVLRRGLKGSWIQAVLKMTSQSVARRAMGLAVLLVIGMAASEAQAQPPFGGPPPMGGRRHLNPAVSWIGGMREPPAEDEHEITPWVSTLRLFLLGVTIQCSEQLLLGASHCV